ncbi:MAG: DUF2490 domain-containing protein [Cyclobacteriaceae bacterium]|uniref:DUF2490 domain-containing protein n=1 Tax=uncultured Algoriphagus sp. TaxID=417365 RepID=UPI002592BDDE|nr:DUF2490 domain-containing protein [uncultured Algoriphagus sp.]MCR9083910.1 DUF2490 domain-containing protein [Cyclobacteriaceae bacterium]
MKKVLLICVVMSLAISSRAQTEVDDSQLGAWYMYFFNKKFGDSQFGIQGDYQFRYWNMGSDLEQILLRTGFTYTPKNTNVMFTLGYAFISSGEFGEGDATTPENRIYQEALLPQKLGNRVYLTHRFRYEQRWVQNQDFRTRYRYNLFINVPINGTELRKNVLYAALYNEIFINGQTDIGDGRMVERFDRNRTYLGLGFGLRDNLRLQVGWMNQTTSQWSKGQTQLSLHHSF